MKKKMTGSGFLGVFTENGNGKGGWSIKEIVIFQKRLLLPRGIYRLRCACGMMVPTANSLPVLKDTSASGIECPGNSKSTAYQKLGFASKN